MKSGKMKECEKYLCESDETGYSLYNVLPADQIVGFKKGWKAAMGLILAQYRKYDMKDWDYIACTIKDIVKEELQG